MRKLAVGLGLLVLPGGLVALAVLLIAFVLSRTERGQRILRHAEPRVPAWLVRSLRDMSSRFAAAGASAAPQKLAA